MFPVIPLFTVTEQRRSYSDHLPHQCKDTTFESWRCRPSSFWQASRRSRSQRRSLWASVTPTSTVLSLPEAHAAADRKMAHHQDLDGHLPLEEVRPLKSAVTCPLRRRAPPTAPLREALPCRPRASPSAVTRAQQEPLHLAPDDPHPLVRVIGLAPVDRRRGKRLHRRGERQVCPCCTIPSRTRLDTTALQIHTGLNTAMERRHKRQGPRRMAGRGSFHRRGCPSRSSVRPEVRLMTTVTRLLPLRGLHAEVAGPAVAPALHMAGRAVQAPHTAASRSKAPSWRRRCITVAV